MFTSLQNLYQSVAKNHDKNKAFKRATVVFVLGGPGVGKGTQCARLVKEYGFVHLSVGDLLREEQSRPGSPFYEMISTCIANGQIVPMKVTVALLENAILRHLQEATATEGEEEEQKQQQAQKQGQEQVQEQEQEQTTKDATTSPTSKLGSLPLSIFSSTLSYLHHLLPRSSRHAKKKKKVYFLVDGFPRQMDQALRFEEEVTRCKFILYLEGPEDVMLQRLLKRAETSGRADDNLESIQKRFKTFRETSYPVIEAYAKQGRVKTVSCVDAPDVVFENVKKVIDEELFSGNK
ncbi:hypothetical protein BGZ94_002532 [Podila epigama]|nr:hypothetical protein BGZ94_002532 [Podila epigama]